MRILAYCPKCPHPRDYRTAREALDAIARHSKFCEVLKSAVVRFAASMDDAGFETAIHKDALAAWIKESSAISVLHNSRTLFLQFLLPIVTTKAPLPIQERLAPIFYMELELIAAQDERSRRINVRQLKRRKGRSGRRQYRVPESTNGYHVGSNK